MILGVQMSARDAGPPIATGTAVVEREELQDVVAEGREFGFLTLDTILAAVEEAELDREQTDDLLRQLEEHSVEVIDPIRDETDRFERDAGQGDREDGDP